MEIKLNNIFKYIVPILMASILFIPFICVDGSGVDYIYLSPLKILFEKHINNFTNILFLLLIIGYVVLSVIKQNSKIARIKRIVLILSTVFYCILFKVTSNTNLNLLSVILNMIVLIIYILSYFKEYILTKMED